MCNRLLQIDQWGAKMLARKTRLATDLRFVLLGVSLLLVAGCAVLPVSDGEQAGVFQVFEPHGDLTEMGVGFGGYWFRDQQPGAFIQLQASYSGSVTGVHYPALPSEGVGDPITARERNGALFAIGPTWRVNDRMAVYGGLGIGSSSEWIERIDGDLELSPTGYYHYEGDREYGLHGSIGSLLQLGGGWILDVGYGSYSDAVHFGIGYSY